MKIYFNRKTICCKIVFILFPLFFSFAQTSNLSQGETLFKENNASDAVEVLEYEVLKGEISDNTYNFLGLGYYQLGDYEKSIDAFKRGLKAQPQNVKLLSYNLGNTYYAQKNYEAAIEAYSNSITAEPLFYDAILNRANALLMAGRLVSAKEDYEHYIEKCPDDTQRERIELLIKALEEEIARREEEARLLAEQNKAQWEEYDAGLKEKKSEGYKADWEEVDSLLTDNANDGPAEWEKISDAYDKALYEEKDEKVEVSEEKKSWESFEKEEAPAYEEKKKQAEKDYWEAFEHEEGEKLSKGASLYENYTDDQNWESFSDDEVDEMKKLEEESRAERQKWLSDKRKQENEQKAYEMELKKRQQQQSLDDERRMREELLEEMMKAEDERRKKLLEDVANSLQNTDSTNLTSGAEDLLEYDLEGELD